MEVEQILLDEIEVSEFNTRKDLADGQFDSTIEDLARSIEQQGLLQPITVYKKSDGRYALVAVQRRLLAQVPRPRDDRRAGAGRDDRRGRDRRLARRERASCRHEPA